MSQVGPIEELIAKEEEEVSESKKIQPSEISPISPPSPPREHPVPEDSILYDAVIFNREFSEAPDSFSIAPLLCLAGYLLTPDCKWNFAGDKYCNLFNFVVAPPGVRKSTAFGLAEKVASKVLDIEIELHEGSASDSALFEQFEKHPHKLQFEDEGNTLLEYWNRQGTGKELASRYLKLYDGKPWSQTFKHQKSNETGSQHKLELATLSFALGGTPNTAKFAGVSSATGLRRRFGYYVSIRKARKITWPSVDYSKLQPLCDQFLKLRNLSGEFALNSEAKEYWNEIHDYTQKIEESLTGIDTQTETKQAAMSEFQSRVLKLAGIMEACRWAKTGQGTGLLVRKETLFVAFFHQKACIAAADEMETLGRLSAIKEKADIMLAKISTDGNNPVVKGYRKYTKSELTTIFANHSGRNGSMTTNELYLEIIPNLESRGFCKKSKEGRSTVFYFAAEEQI